MFLVSILRVRGSQCLPKGSNTQLSPHLFPMHVLNPTPRVRHSASVLTALSKAPDSRQGGFSILFCWLYTLYQALTQLLLSPRCLCLPAELRVHLQLLWLIVNTCKEGGRALLSSLLEVLCQDQLQGLVEDEKLRLLGLQHTVGCVYVVL